MDFGFAAFLEKFESHFGHWPTKILLFLIGTSVAIFCCSTIWSLALKPLIAPIVSSLSAGSIWKAFAETVWTGGALAFGALMASAFAAHLADWYYVRNLRRLEKKSKRLLSEEIKYVNDAKTALAKAEQLTTRAKAMTESSQILHHELTKLAKNQRLSPPSIKSKTQP